MESIRRFFEAPTGSFFLLGPRGTGKSSWAVANFPGALRIDLLQPDVLREFSARPERLRELVAALPDGSVVILDEVQRVPELSSVVHAVHEARKSIRFVLTGSSGRKLRSSGADLLAGRAVLRTMHPFIAAELGASFRLSSALELGMLPLVLGASDPAEALRTYHALYLREEVQQEGLIRNLGAFARFLEAISFSHASLLNISNVARECQVERKIAENYVTILEDLVLGTRVQSFTRRAARAVVAHPKFFWFDTGVFRAIRPRGPMDSGSEIDGAALEGLVFQHLIAWVDGRRESNSLHFWRTRSGVEVDFVLYGADGFHAVEVKNSQRVHTSDLRGLRAFREDYPESQPRLVYRGTDRLVIDGIPCTPCEEFLMSLDPRRDFPV